MGESSQGKRQCTRTIRGAARRPSSGSPVCKALALALLPVPTYPMPLPLATSPKMPLSLSLGALLTNLHATNSRA